MNDNGWRTAAACNPNGSCVDVSLPHWRKASASGGNGGQCVEFAMLPDSMIGLRDSKDPDGPVLAFTSGEWLAFLDGATKGEFDPASSSQVEEMARYGDRFPGA
jgi:hypothetical protein